MKDKIKEIVAGFMGVRVSEIDEEKNFIEMGMDSLTLMKIIIDIEKEYNIHFEDEEIIEIRTIDDIFNLSNEKNSQ